MGLAFAVSQRSHDVHTQHGCVIVSEDGRILSTGYNGFPRGLNDGELPITRPEKYPWMVHSEANAIYNAANAGVSLSGSTAYVTGKCCATCLMSLHQAGVSTIIMWDGIGWQKDDAESKVWNGFVEKSGIKYEFYRGSLEWLEGLVGLLKEKKYMGGDSE